MLPRATSPRLPALPLAGALAFLSLALAFAPNALASAIDSNAVHQAALKARSVHLDGPARIHLAESFRALVAIPGGSGGEQGIREESRRRLEALGARLVPIPDSISNAPINLAMRLDGHGSPSSQPGLLLNAHLDTLVVSTPQHLAFDAGSGDFYHQLEADRSAVSSFGGDDRSGLVVILEALRHLHRRRWTTQEPHPPILVLFTGSEEIGLRGARHLARHHPGLFDHLGLSITVDGPLDYETGYPAERLVAVVAEADAGRAPYAGVLQILAAHASKAGVGWARSEVGLGKGDFAAFPPQANAGLHLRSPVRGWHRRERVQVQDLVHHVDLLIDVIEGWHAGAASPAGPKRP